jgi:DNA (cytosine-5)-methyltransferase 1
VKQRTHIDLFSGIGGFKIAAENNGVKTIAFAEIDKYASKILKQFYPKIKNYGDIGNVPSIGCWLITGGFPCQPFSSSGLKKGKEDDRYLWPAMFNVIERNRPTWTLIENVAAIEDMALETILADMESIGYASQPFIIPACATGLPHRRDRIWIVSNSSKERHEKMLTKETLLRKTNNKKNARQPMSIRGQDFWIRSCKDFTRAFRVDNGIPQTQNRVACLGNAIVPQIAQEIIRCMILSEK